MRVRGAISGLLTSLVVVVLAAPTAVSDSSSFPPSVESVILGDLTGYQWMLPATNAAAAHTVATGRGVTIAVVDTGVDATHPDLVGRVVPGAMVVPDELGRPVMRSATVSQTSDDWDGHGSHVAGIAAADADGNGVTGLAPDARIMPIDIAPRRNPIRSAPQFFRIVAAGIDYAAANGADVVNLSLGGPSSGIEPSERNDRYLSALAAMCDSVQEATAQGVVVVAAAGNEGTWGNPEVKPAACPSAVTVAALTPTFDRTYWSSFDAAVDIAAPGEDILSVDSTVADDSRTPHLLASGTSMAAPLVAGAAALVRELHPDWSAVRIATRLSNTAKDIGIPGRDPESGHGLVDAAAAVGAPSSPALRQNFMTTWFEDVRGDSGDRVVVSWTPPHVDPVAGYTVTVHAPSEVVTYDVDPMTVRTAVSLPAGAWWTVTAHYPYGELVTYPTARDFDALDRPPKLRGVRLSRAGDRLLISWKQPADPTQFDRIVAYAYYDTKPGGGRNGIRVDDDEPFPTGMSVRLRDEGPWLRGRWLDAHVDLMLVNRDEEGRFLGSRWQMILRGSPALHGSHVEWVAASGARSVELEGTVSPMRAERACGDRRCALEPAEVVIRGSGSATRVPVVLNSRGTFHATVPVRRGQDVLTVKVVGPLRLSSGPFVRLPIQR